MVTMVKIGCFQIIKNVLCEKSNLISMSWKALLSSIITLLLYLNWILKIIKIQNKAKYIKPTYIEIKSSSQILYKLAAGNQQSGKKIPFIQTTM